MAIRIKAYDRIGGNLLQYDASFIVLEDENENPIVIAIQLQSGLTTVVTADDVDFSRILAGLGVDRLVTVKKLDTAADNKGELLDGPRRDK